MLGHGLKHNLTLFGRHQAFIRTTQCQLNSECRGEQDIDLPRLNLLQVAGRNLGSLGQFVLRHASANPLPAHVRAKDLDSLPFFLGNCHDILHRFLMMEMNDTYIVKRFRIMLVMFDVRLRISIRTKLTGFNFSGTTAIFNRITELKETT